MTDKATEQQLLMDMGAVKQGLSDLQTTVADLANVMRQGHTPLTCPVAQDVSDLKAWKQRWRGGMAVLAVVAAFAGFVISTCWSWIAPWIEKRAHVGGQ